MNDEFRKQRRILVEGIRRVLRERGYGEIMFRSAWLKDGEGSDPFLMDVPVSPELIVTLRPEMTTLDTPTSASWTREADNFASALITLHKGEKNLTKYAKDMMIVAANEVRKARDEGLDIRVLGVGFMPVYAEALSLPKLLEALDYVVAEVTLEITESTLERDTVILTLEEPEDLPTAFEEYRYLQAERQRREDELEAIGADLEVGEISLEILKMTGEEPGKILLGLLEQGLQTFKLTDGSRVTVTNDGGVAEAHLETDQLLWNGKVLKLRGSNVEGEDPRAVITALGSRTGCSIFASRPVVSSSSVGGGSRAYRYDEEQFGFDAGSMHIWSRNDAQSVAA